MNLLIDELSARYRSGALTPRAMLDGLLPILARQPDDCAWISRVPAARLLEQAAMLERCLEEAAGDWSRFPLYGIPFAVKDNIDAAGLQTTAACREFAYAPEASATVVARLQAAGALLIGKTNLDQFATGLNGTRSPYGAVPNPFDARFISGGSSSGSASVVARGLVSFALGSDTAGSGRVPAGFNNIVGLKPTRGWLSTRGLVPACRTLDCISIFSLTAADARRVAAVAAGFDAADPYSRPTQPGPARFAARLRVGVPDRLEFRGDADYARLFDASVERMRQLGADVVPVDIAPFHETAALLYQGPWVAERYAAVETMMREHPDALHPVVREVIAQATRFTAVDAFKAQYRLEFLRRDTAPVWDDIDLLLAPTAPTIPTLAAMLAEPVARNSELGLYTNFVNLLDLCAIALPAGMRDDGLPFGVTLIAPAWADAALLELGARWQEETGLPLGATGIALPRADAMPVAGAAPPGFVRVAVVGAHLSGMPLNAQLTTRGAVLVGAAHTAARYRLFALPGTMPPKPGLLRIDDAAGAAGARIALELWDMPIAHFGWFVAEIPAPLGIGTLELDNGSLVKGFICEPFALAGAQDISSFGGWRGYIASRSG